MEEENLEPVKKKNTGNKIPMVRYWSLIFLFSASSFINQDNSLMGVYRVDDSKKAEDYGQPYRVLRIGERFSF